ncbi:MAG: hypothetical protein CME33_14055 [Gimesia sp.]|uniref:HNH/ENDO VII family nuclease n=1 Tax=Gimesia sp. TaxID=2024833 RepID=UPI000C57F332|nr:HNH/ENDO VII family nuclease [Gimesia sp.]MAX37677.1 hypothetical protein [Gimesia sp.]|tara:strand:+ start:4524 stop:6407 length:1884 start_codon:yes stop_codon:yes gene_type:complete
MTQKNSVLLALVSMILGLFVSGEVKAEEPETTRSYLQASLGYYSASDGWNVYSTSCAEMDRSLEYSEYDFKRLSIEKIDSLARQSKKVRELYERHKVAADSLGLKPHSKKTFWDFSKKQSEVVENLEDTAVKWPTYRKNMNRYKLTHKSADEFLQLAPKEREALLAKSEGTQRSWYQALNGNFSAEDGWNTYKKCRQSMGQQLEYSYYDFTHLEIDKLDSLARAAQKTHDLYKRYSVSISAIDLKPISRAEFCRRIEDQSQLTSQAEDTAAKWPEYRKNMKRLGIPYHSSEEFLSLSSEARAKNYELSRGSSRSATQFMLGYYSSEDGWDTYQKSLKSMNLPLEYSESEFINFGIIKLDQLARHAKECEQLYLEFLELSKLAGKPSICSASDLYKSKELTKWRQEYEKKHNDWAIRILYSDSCRRVGTNPNWAEFELRKSDEQIEAAVLADSIASNFEEYKDLCKTLGHPTNTAFLNQSIESQRQKVAILEDELWQQRKQKIKTGATIVAVIAAAIIAKKAYDEFQPTTSPTLQQNGSQIDRDAFGQQRRDFWKTEAKSNPERYSDSSKNLERMTLGKAPIGNDGFPMELHHPRGDPNAILIPMTRTDHRLGDNYLKNHPWLFEKKP